MIASEHIDVGRLVDATTPLSEIPAVFERFETQSDAIKMMVGLSV